MYRLPMVVYMESSAAACGPLGSIAATLHTKVGFWVFAGSKHKTMLEARSGAGPIKAYPRPGAKLKNGTTSTLKGSGLQNKTFHCQICDVHVNSEIQLKQVQTQRAHTEQPKINRDEVAGCDQTPQFHVRTKILNA